MDTAQLGLLFFCGFLLSRLFVVSRLPERIVHNLVTRELNFATLIFLLISLSACLSVLIPNAITAITVLPIITLLQRQWHQHGKDHQARVTTALALAVIYGANIGGVGAITATPALPPPGGVARGGGFHQAGCLSGRGVLGTARPRVRRPVCPPPGGGAGPGGSWGQPHRPNVHGRPLGGLALSGHAPGRIRLHALVRAPG